jgi:hypothetical protein
MTPFPPGINDPGATLTNHRFVRDGSFWTCAHCHIQFPFGGGMPDVTTECRPRPWLS